MGGRKGLYEIFLGFFLVIVLVFGTIFVLGSAMGSSSLYASIKRTGSAPRDALAVKDAVLTCHRTTYLDADLLDAPCPAKTMGHGYRVVQEASALCDARNWSYVTGEGSATIPFVVTVEQPASSIKCLARLEIVLGDDIR